jgi:uncharacterized protein involved in tolerance to divalent cations
MVDFEIDRHRTNLYIVEPLALYELDTESSRECQDIIDRQVTQELEACRIFLPHVSLYTESQNVCLKTLADLLVACSPSKRNPQSLKIKGFHKNLSKD